MRQIIMEHANTVAESNAVEKPTFWHEVAECAADRISKLFEGSGIELCSIIGGEGRIQSYTDAKKALAYILCHAETANEKACGILSACEWLHACNELRKHGLKERVKNV